MQEARTRKEGVIHIELTANIIWKVWKSRNRWIFNKELKESKMVIDIVVQEWKKYEEANKRTTGVSMNEIDEFEHVEIA